jgi:hypothetical protein
MPGPCVTINDQQIPWSYIQWVRNRIFRGDWDSTIDCFWKARKATGDPRAIIRYINKGLEPDEKGNRYSMIASIDRDAGKMKMIRAWWDCDVYKPKGNAMLSVKEIFRQFAT